jgi:uncharacterized coiled-coil protein SlyX
MELPAEKRKRQLRRTLAAKDEEIRKLKATVAQQKTTIEMLYGQLDSHTS